MREFSVKMHAYILDALVQKLILLKEQNAYFAYNFCSVSVAGVIMPQIVQWFHDMQR